MLNNNMKNLQSYIIESIEWEQTRESGYGVMTLVRHENLDLSSLSEEDFIKYMLEDFNQAVEEYSKICKPLNDKRIADNIEREIKQAIKFAEKKWKTQKKRDEYIENIRKNAQEKKWYLEDPKRIFFDLKPDKGNMGIRQECIIDSKSNEKTLKIAYEEMQKSKYFKKGTGWAFKYDAYGKDKAYSFRPYIDILLDENDRAEQKRDEENLSNAISDFYANTNYWGD